MVRLSPHGNTALTRVYVDDVWVGLGLGRDCQALAEELREDFVKAEWLKRIMATAHRDNHGA